MAKYPIEFDDLEESQKRVLLELIPYCRRKVGDARTEIKRAKSVPSTRVKSFFGIDGTRPIDLNNLDVIASKYNRIAGVLLGEHPLEFEGESGTRRTKQGIARAYVYSHSYRSVGEDVTVHLMRDAFFASDRDSMARAIIHEIGHAVVNLEDHQYFLDRSETMPTVRAMSNADTYAHFAITKPYSGGLRGDPPTIDGIRGRSR